MTTNRGWSIAGALAAGIALACALARPPDRPAQRRPDPAPPAVERARIERAVDQGLAWLAGRQGPRGCWTGHVGHKRGDGYIVFSEEDDQAASGSGHPGVSALAGLAFLANGHVPERGPYGDHLARLIDYLLDGAGGDDYVTDNGSRMYSHAFAVLFLSQVHGMASRRAGEVRERLVRATRFILHVQNGQGAWRYGPGTDEADLSVTVCQVQALRAARNVGIDVSRPAIDRVIDYIRRSRIASGSLAGAFYYKIEGRAARTRTSFAINAAAVTALHSAGLYHESEYGRALRLVEEEYPEVSGSFPSHFYFWYGNYYAAQALHMEGGIRWERYWRRLSRDLVDRQRPDGSWENDVGPGDVFATAVACLLLCLPDELLPIFQT